MMTHLLLKGKCSSVFRLSALIFVFLLILNVNATEIRVSGGGNTLQNAINSAVDGDVILVDDGIYNPIYTGNKSLTIKSINGLTKTFIEGGRLSRCATLGVERCSEDGNAHMFDVLSYNTTLVGFTLRNGCRDLYESGASAAGGGVAGGILKDCKIVSCNAYLGGGAYKSKLIRCVINRCAAYSGDYCGMGGGANNCILENCLISDCTADGDAGGAIGSDLHFCTITGNRLLPSFPAMVFEDSMNVFAGDCSSGVNFCNVSNSIVWGNMVEANLYNKNGELILDDNDEPKVIEVQLNWCIIGEDLGDQKGKFSYSCTYPAPQETKYITNNIAVDPLFVDEAKGDFRLKKDSPCIDSAESSFDNFLTDLLGNTRCMGSASDMGAYEYYLVVDPLPELDRNASESDILSVLSTAADPALALNITNVVDYMSFRNWAQTVKGGNSSMPVGVSTVKESLYAWLSYALGLDILMNKDIVSKDIRIEEFSFINKNTNYNLLSLKASISELKIGSASIADLILKNNLKSVIGVECSTKLIESDFTSDDINVVIDSVADGKVNIIVDSKKLSSNSFFIRLRVLK